MYHFGLYPIINYEGNKILDDLMSELELINYYAYHL